MFISQFYKLEIGGGARRKQEVDLAIGLIGRRPDWERAKLSKTFPALAQDFVIIEMKERPGMGLPSALLGVGAICGVITGFVQLKRRMPTRHTFAEGGIAIAAK